MYSNCVQYKRFVWELNNIINLSDNGKSIVFLCLGTTTIIGDSFGPIVGTLLKKTFKRSNTIKIIGDLNNAMTYNKIEEALDFIREEYSTSLIIVLDSALSDKHDIGKIFVQNRGLKYAESLHKHNKFIGNISIKAVVGENMNNNIQNFENLKNVSYEQVKSMSDIVSKGIIDVMNKKENNGKNIYK